jgi:hypothetical protein
MRGFRTTILACASLALLAACAKPLPEGKANYAGAWKGGPISLVITPEGRAVYKREEGNMSKSIDAPVKEFNGDNFVVGVGFMSTEFKVSAPPHQDGGVWKMTVDGVELTRISDGGAVVESGGTST